MIFLALQMKTSDPAFWVLVIVALSFLVIALALVSIAVVVNRAVKTVKRLEERVEPLLQKVSVLSDQGRQIAAQGKEIAEQVGVMSGHLSTATMHLSESAVLIRDEVRELKLIVNDTATRTRDKVALVSRTIDETQEQFVTTSSYIRNRVIEPARELAAIMAGFRRGLEVLVAPAPKPINQTYGDDEMFIG